LTPEDGEIAIGAERGAIAFRFNPLFSLNASVPVYAYINVEANTGTKAKPVYTATTKHGVLGDASLAAGTDVRREAVWA
jgi:hypothetical protein